jgi:hypothetical protein
VSRRSPSSRSTGAWSVPAPEWGLLVGADKVGEDDGREGAQVPPLLEGPGRRLDPCRTFAIEALVRIHVVLALWCLCGGVRTTSTNCIICILYAQTSWHIFHIPSYQRRRPILLYNYDASND